MSDEPSPPDSVSQVEFQRQLDHMIQAGLQVMGEPRPVDIPEAARLWAALAPGWTESLAERCGFPGVGDAGALPLLERMRGAGLLTVYDTDEQPGEVVEGGYYVMTPSSRADTLQAYLFADRRPSSPVGLAAKSGQSQSPIVQALQSAGLGRAGATAGATTLLTTTAEIGRQVQHAGPEASTPREMRRWCELAVSAEEPKKLVEVFEEHVRPQFSASNVAAIRDWIEVARPLAALLEYSGDAQLSIAIAQAGRAIELIERRRSDFRHLVSFHRREEQVRAVSELLDGPDDLWALHFIGPAGVGKTMIVRYITCLLARAPDSPCAQDPNPFQDEVAVARIDFDYLNLDYPRLHPGLLLEAFAQELRPAATTLATSRFADAIALFDQVHQDLKASGYSPNVRPLTHPLLIQGIRVYNDALQALGKRVLLILDTCEELAKADPAGGPHTTLEDTFRILRALHDGSDTLLHEQAPARGGVPRLRVMFCGRRLLARSGAGWSSPDTELPPRPYLRLQEIRGFTHDEARRYLERERIHGDLIEAVIQSSSPDLDSGQRIVLDDPPGESLDVPRCSPYQLRLYMDWAREEPPPDPDTLTSAAAGNYVELRIVQRLRDEDLKRTLPLAALLGHFDLPTLDTASDLDSESAKRVFDALRSQEWVGAHRTSTNEQEREILDLAPNIRDRMVAYFAARQEPTESARARAASRLREMTLRWELQRLDWSDFDAALRVMEHDLAEGADWWMQVEERLLSERDPDWTLKLLDWLTGKDAAAGAREQAARPDTPPENALRPFVLATQARVWLHQSDVGRLATTWREVADKARARADRPAFGRLYRRALAGQIAATRFTQAVVAVELVQAFWTAWTAAREPFRSPQDAASAIAAVEVLVDAAETLAEHDLAAAQALLALPASDQDPTGGPVSGPRWVADAVDAASGDWPKLGPEADQAGSGLRAFACSLAGRALSLVRSHQAALGYLHRSLRDDIVRPAPTRRAPRALWADWLPPENPGARLLVEFGRTAYPALLSAGETLGLIPDWPHDPTCADVDRLHSLRLQLRLALGQPELTALASLGWVDAQTRAPVFRSDGFLPRPDPINAHRLVPPLFVSACEAFAANGLAEEARRQLRYVADNRSRFDLETVRHAERALLRLVRRLRLNEEDEPSDTTLPTSPRIDDVALTWSLAALDGLKRPMAVPDLGRFEGDWRAVHGAWQTRYVLDQETARAVVAYGQATVLPALNARPPREDQDFGNASLTLDLLEVRRLAEAYDLAGTLERSDLYELGFDPARWIDAHPSQPGEALCLLLRSLALAESRADLDVPAELVHRLGQRRAAETALEQAELLALRLPECAVLLLNWAVEQFSASDDPQGAFFARTLATLLAVPALPAAAPAEGAALARYDVLRESFLALHGATPLPAREDVERLAGAVTEDGLDALQPVTLRPWLVRLVACLVRQRQHAGDTSTAADTAALRSWLDAHCGRLVDSVQQLPTEWSRFFSGAVGASAPPAASQPQAVPAAERTWPYLLLGLAVIAGLLAGAFFVWRWLVGLVTVATIEDASVGDQVLAFGGTLIVVGLLMYLGTRGIARLRSGWAALRELELEIESASTTGSDPYTEFGSESTAWQGGEARLTAALWSPRLAWQWPPYVLVQTRPLGEQAVQVSGVAPYRALAESVPPPLADQLGQLTGGVRGHLPLSIWLKPRHELHGPCWEAMLALALPNSAVAPPGNLPLRFQRAAETIRQPLPPPRRPYRGASLALTEVAAAIVERVLAARGGREQIAWRVARSLAGSSDVHVLHVVGSVVPELSSLVLRLVPEQGYATQIGYSVQSAHQAGEVAGGPPQTLSTLRAADLRRLCPEMRVCILQGYPEEARSTRQDSDRHNALLTRVFAAEVAREGVAVIVIPPLDPSLASTGLEHFYRALPSYFRQGIPALHLALTQLRSAIVARSTERDTGWELALDVCVYDIPATPSHVPSR